MTPKRLLMLIGAVFVALLVAPAAQTKAKPKPPDTVIKVVDLAKANAKAAKKLEKAVKKVKGVTVVVVAKKKNEVKVWHKPEVKKEDLEAAVTGAGFEIEGGEEGDGGDDAEPAPAPKPNEDEGGDDYEEEGE